MIVPIRSETVSLPFEVYTVVFVPSLMISEFLLMMPSVDSGVVTLSGTVPVPVATLPDVLAAGDAVFEPVDEPDDLFEDEPVWPAIADCSAAESSVLTRLRAL